MGGGSTCGDTHAEMKDERKREGRQEGSVFQVEATACSRSLRGGRGRCERKGKGTGGAAGEGNRAWNRGMLHPERRGSPRRTGEEGPPADRGQE